MNTNEKQNPVIVLVDPQLGENIGAAARAMLNCGLLELQLVRPRDGWPSEKARAMSSGALDKMPEPQVFETLGEAVADCHFVAATTARHRDQVKKVFTARSISRELHERVNRGEKTAILFGAERTGLDNDDISLAHAIINIPLNPDFSSLNLAQAVLLVTYEWRMGGMEDTEGTLVTNESPLATHEETESFLARLEQDLEESYFFRNPDMRPSMMRNIRNVYTRAELTEQEVRTLHGMLSAFQGKKDKPSK
jgi:tRNA/rRNA methyltransferase